MITCEAEEIASKNKLVTAYKQSSQYREITKELTAILEQAPKDTRSVSQVSGSFLWQVCS